MKHQWKNYQRLYDTISRVVMENTKSNLSENQYLAATKLSAILANHPLRDGITQDLLLLPDISSHIMEYVNTKPFNTGAEIFNYRWFNNNVFN